jgi:autotransporter-associated beta strand protein
MRPLVRALVPCIFFFAGHALHAGSATWGLAPTNSEWTTATNWTPNTVPNGPNDTATFGTSDTTKVLLFRRPIELDGIVFNTGASAFTLTVRNTASLLLSGFGIENNSGVTQRFVIGSGNLDTLAFTNQAAAGSQTGFTVTGDGTVLNFYDQALAGSGSFTMKNSTAQGPSPQLLFRDNSTADNATFTNLGGLGNQSNGGDTVFHDDATAANATFLNKGGTQGAATGGKTWFFGNVNADQCIITNEGGSADLVAGGTTFFMDNSTAANAIVTCEGAQSASNGIGQIQFNEISLGGNATVIANGGSNGGRGGLIQFNDTSDGEQIRIQLFGNGTLDIGNSARGRISIGSFEGEGIVLLGTHNLTIGSNNLNTIFSGVIQGDGGIIKVGSGALVLSGANSYTGATILNGGVLRANNRSGSATGIGTVQVNGGTLSGGGIISGAVTIGSGNGLGALLAPGNGATTLTLQSTLTLQTDGTYTWRVRPTSAQADKVIANGVTINNGAQFHPGAIGTAPLSVGTSLVAISNTAATPIAGAFSNLPDGSTITVGTNTFQADYEGGDGNDLTLTVVP